MGRVHVLAVLKMVRADLVRVVQLHCSFRAKITWPSVYDPFIDLLRGGAGRKTVLLIFQSTHFILHLL